MTRNQLVKQELNRWYWLCRNRPNNVAKYMLTVDPEQGNLGYWLYHTKWHPGYIAGWMMSKFVKELDLKRK